jgi:hypothetical protein
VSLLDSLLAWIIDKIVTGIEMFGMSIMSVLDVNLGLFVRVFPIAGNTHLIFRVTATSLIALMIMWGLFKNMLLPLGGDADPPLQLIARGAVFWFLSWNSLAFTTMLISIAGTPFELMVAIPDEPINFVSLHGLIGAVAAVAAIGPAWPAILAVVFVCVLGWNFLKLMIEAVERYLVVGVLVFTSPLAFAMGVSKATLPVFQSWCRMLGGQVLLLILNIWTMRMFFSMIRVFLSNPVMEGW